MRYSISQHTWQVTSALAHQVFPMPHAFLRPNHVRPLRNPFLPTEAIGLFLSRQNAISVTADGKLEEEWGAEAWVRPLGQDHRGDFSEVLEEHSKRIDEAEQILESRRARPLRLAVLLVMAAGLATFIGVTNPETRLVMVEAFTTFVDHFAR